MRSALKGGAEALRVVADADPSNHIEYALMTIPAHILDQSAPRLPNPSSTSDGLMAISLICSLPAELLDKVYAHISLADRYSFALACKHFARYAFSSPTFLVPNLRLYSSDPCYNKKRTIKPLYIPTKLTKPRTRAYRDMMQLLSKGWCPTGLHWCDNCQKFCRFDAATRELWYGGVPRGDFPEHTKKSRQWTQDIGLSMDGEVCWNHYCPQCARKHTEKADRSKRWALKR